MFYARFHCAICYASDLQLVLPIQHSLVLASVMPDGDADDADTSKSFVKDLDNIKRMDFLLQVVRRSAPLCGEPSFSPPQAAIFPS